MASSEIDQNANILREIKERQIHSLPSLILRQLRSMIFTGQVRPGGKINEAVIAKQLSVSLYKEIHQREVRRKHLRFAKTN